MKKIIQRGTHRAQVIYRWKLRQIQRSLFVRLFIRLRPFWPQFAVYGVILVAYELLQLGGTAAITLGLKILTADAPLYFWGLFVLGHLLYKGIVIESDTLVDWTIHKLITAIDKYLNIQAMNKFLELRLAWHQKNNSGVLVGKVQDGTEKATNILIQLLWDMLPTTVQAISNTIAVIVLWWFGYQIAAICYLSYIIFFKLTLDNYKKQKNLRDRRHNLIERKWSVFVEYIQGIQEIISTNQTKKVSSDFRKLYDRIERLSLRQQRIGTLRYNRYRNWVTSFGDALIMALLLWYIRQGDLEIADLFFLWTTTQRLFYAVWRLGRIFDLVGENSEGFFRLDHLLRQKPVQIFATHPTVELSGQLGFRIENVEFGYNGSDQVIRDLSLEIPAGKTLAIVGPSGSGKSTLGKMLKGLWPVRSGSILINDNSMYDLTEDQLHDFVGNVNQADNIFIFDCTILQNLLNVKPDATMEEVVRATMIANIHEEIESFPKGYYTIVGEKGIHLSGGQKQRLAIARAILRSPQVLILDEPTSGLDLENETKVKQAIFASAPGRTTIIIAHRLVTVRDADRIVVMNEGQIVEQGTHNELLALDGIYAHLHNLDQESLKALSE